MQNRNAVRECGFKVLPHLPYSHVPAPSDYHLFPKTESAWKHVQR